MAQPSNYEAPPLVVFWERTCKKKINAEFGIFSNDVKRIIRNAVKIHMWTFERRYTYAIIIGMSNEQERVLDPERLLVPQLHFPITVKALFTCRLPDFQLGHTQSFVLEQEISFGVKEGLIYLSDIETSEVALPRTYHSMRGSIADHKTSEDKGLGRPMHEGTFLRSSSGAKDSTSKLTHGSTSTTNTNSSSFVRLKTEKAVRPQAFRVAKSSRVARKLKKLPPLLTNTKAATSETPQMLHDGRSTEGSAALGLLRLASHQWKTIMDELA